jgi:hypothetical protein
VSGGGEGEVLNPVQVEMIVRNTANAIGKSVKVVSEAHAKWKTALRIYEHAFAVSYMGHEGPSHEKKYAAEKNTQQERANADVAEVAFKHAERQMKALEIQLSAAQTISKSIQQMYGASGTGRGN